MNELLRDWKDFCEGRKRFDKCHFYTLFWEEIGPDGIADIFQYFPHSTELADRTKEYLFGKRERISESTLKDFLVGLVVRDLDQKKAVIGENSNLIGLLERLEIEFIQDSEKVIELKARSPYVDFYDAINDKLSDWIVEDGKAFALYEAFYGLTKNYEMVWHLFGPLFRVRLDSEAYYRLSIHGGVYSFSNDKILVSKRF
jgi:hypothetical protein